MEQAYSQLRRKRSKKKKEKMSKTKGSKLLGKLTQNRQCY